VLVEINDRSRVGDIRRLFPRGYGCYSIDETRPVVRRVGLFAQPFDSRNYLFSVRDSREVAALAAWRR
jgi:hypothetical protein